MKGNSAFPAGNLQTQANSFVSEGMQWMQAHWRNIPVAVAAVVGIIVLLHLIRAWGLHLCRRGNGDTNWYAIIGRAVSRTGNFFIIMTAIRLVAGYAYAPPTIATTVRFFFTIAAVFQAAIWAREIVFGVVEQRARSDGESGLAYATAFGIIRLLVTIVLFAVALVVVLSNLGVNVTGLIAGLGVGGIAIGLAAQGIFADLFSALAILFDKPFRVGDAIAFDTSEGTVEAIGLKSTRIRGAGGELRIIANKKLLDFEIRNNSNRRFRRMKLAIVLDYRTSAEKAEQIPAMLREIVEGEKLGFSKGLLVDFVPGGILFEVEFDSPSPDAALAEAARSRMGLAILKRFEAEGLAFAMPLLASAKAK